MQFLWAFIVGGLICVIGQLLMDGVKLTPAHTMSTLVVTGALADAFGVYDPWLNLQVRVQPSPSQVSVIP